MDQVRKEAHNIVYAVLNKKRRSEDLLLKASKKISSENKTLLYHIVKGSLKMIMNLDYIAASLCEEDKYSKTDLKIKVLLYIGLYQLIYCDNIPEYHALNETVELAKLLYDRKVSSFVNAVLRQYQRNSHIEYPQDRVKRISVQHSYPLELLLEWEKLWGLDEVEKMCLYFNEVPKLSARINQIATSKKRLIKYFQRKSIDFIEVEHSKNIIVTSQAQKALSDVSFDEGYFSIQDPAAAMVVDLLAPEVDDSILDLFAGPGGKCTYVSEIMQNTGEVIAVDRYPQKVKKIKRSLHRLQITNTITVNEDAFKYGPRAPAYDKVLLDVPCSGWGVFQKKPELRWQSLQDMKSLLKLQEQALHVGAIFVKPGGYLVYSTCTMNPKENEKQVEKFLLSNKDFRVVNAADFIPKRFTNSSYLYTIPHRDKSDGAFAVKMKKND